MFKSRPLQNYLICANTKCGCIFSKERLETGTAKKLGFMRFCCEDCKRKYLDSRESNSREQP